MSIDILQPSMKGYTDPHYLVLVKKINELVVEINESFRSDLRLRNEMIEIRNNMKDLTNLVRNR